MSQLPQLILISTLRYDLSIIGYPPAFHTYNAVVAVTQRRYPFSVQFWTDLGRGA